MKSVGLNLSILLTYVQINIYTCSLCTSYIHYVQVAYAYVCVYNFCINRFLLYILSYYLVFLTRRYHGYYLILVILI